MRYQGNEVLLLSTADHGYFIEQGGVSIYAAQMDHNQQLIGKRHYLFSCYTHCLVWGGSLCEKIKTDEGNYTLLAVPHEDSELERVSRADLLQSTTEKWTHGLTEWVERQSRYLAEGVDNGYAEKFIADESFDLLDGQNFQPKDRGLYQLTIEQGEATIGDMAGVAMSSSTGSLLFYGFFDLSFTTKGAFRGRFDAASTPSETYLSSLEMLSRLLLYRFYQRMAVSQVQERERLEYLRTQRVDTDIQALRDLNYEEGAKGQQFGDDFPLLRVMEKIAVEGRIHFNYSLELPKDDSVERQMEKIAAFSGIRYRRVSLIGEWWAGDSGQILAFNKETGSPVAILNVPRWGGMKREYRVYDPLTDCEKPLTDDVLSWLSTTAYTFVRPMPDSRVMLNFKSLLQYIAPPFMLDIRLLFILSILSSLVGLFVPMASKMIMDDVIPDASRSLLFDLGVGLVCMSFAVFFFALSRGVIIVRVKTGMTSFLQSMVMDRVLRLPNTFFRQYDSGDLRNRVMMISEISADLSLSAVNLVFSLLTVVVMLALSFYFSAKLALLGFAAAVVIVMVSMFYSYHIRKLSLVMERESGKVFGYLLQIIQGVSKIQVADARHRAFREWSKRYGDQLRRQYRIQRLEYQSGLFNLAIQSVSTALLFYFAGKMVGITAGMQASGMDVNSLQLSSAMLTVGTFFAVQTAISGVITGLNDFFEQFLDIHQQLAKRELVKPILEAELESPFDSIKVHKLEGRIEMRHVSFRYHQDLPWIFRDLSFSVLPGEFVALVGPSGCGKSTAIKILLGLEKVTSGQVLYDQMSHEGLDMQTVRQQCGVVLQNSKISAGSVLFNITTGMEISMSAAWEAAEDSGFADDIRAFPMEMHTVLPEGGGSLSGGQQQRLLITRALAKNPAFVVFDEATSALDNETQNIVTRSLKSRKITRIVVAHRLSTIIDADKILVVDGGRVVESGNYQELVAQNGVFKAMVDLQVE
jgi:NHLM bacteriocin system ABC transporter ATP-binding protein